MKDDKGRFIKLYTEQEAKSRQKESEARYRAKKKAEREAAYKEGKIKRRLEGTATERSRLKRRQKFFDIKSKLSCVDCGISDPRVLDFDHKDPSTKLYVVGRAVQNGTPWQLVLEEIDKCEPRCANCHRIKTADQMGHFKNLSTDGISVDVDMSSS